MVRDNKEEIKKQAKKILDSFAKSLSGVKFNKKDLKMGIGGFRKEDNGVKCEFSFRETILNNAPKNNGDCIIAEKKKW